MSTVMHVDSENARIPDILPVVPILSEQDESPMHSLVQVMTSTMDRILHPKEQSEATTDLIAIAVRFEENWEAVEIEGPHSFDAGTLILKVENVLGNVFMDLQAKTEARTL